jgi:hypothetical protein
VFRLLKERDFELFLHLDGGVVQGDLVLENLRDGGFLENCLPWALGLAGATINTLVRMYVELVWKCL